MMRDLKLNLQAAPARERSHVLGWRMFVLEIMVCPLVSFLAALANNRLSDRIGLPKLAGTNRSTRPVLGTPEVSAYKYAG
jgi:hypothetical protein